jgi:hypothetical protein
MRTITLLLLLTISCCAADHPKDGMVQITKFVVSAPATGRYAPWRDSKNHVAWYAGEIIAITNSAFHYTFFTDVVGDDREYSGKLSVTKDWIVLEHPGIAYPYRVSGVADGVPVLLTWAGYEQWKKTGKVFEFNILYLEKTTQPKK